MGLPQSNVNMIDDVEFINGSVNIVYIEDYFRDVYNVILIDNDQILEWGVNKGYNFADTLTYLVDKRDGENPLRVFQKEIAKDLNEELVRLFYTEEEIRDKMFSTTWHYIKNKKELNAFKTKLAHRIVNVEKVKWNKKEQRFSRMIYVARNEKKTEEQPDNVIQFHK